MLPLPTIDGFRLSSALACQATYWIAMLDHHKIRKAQEAIEESRILTVLADYFPTVVSTIFVGLDTQKSDLDIVCVYSDPVQFVHDFERAYGQQKHAICKKCSNHILSRFYFQDFLFELYSSAQPIETQPAYRHFQMMERLSQLGGDQLRETIRRLKQTGLKTEPAITYLLNLPGNPYEAVLHLECWTDEDILQRLRQRLGTCFP